MQRMSEHLASDVPTDLPRTPEQLEALAADLRAITEAAGICVAFDVEDDRVVMRSGDPRLRPSTTEPWDVGLTNAFAPHSIPSVALSSPDADGASWALALLATPGRVPMDPRTLTLHVERARAVNEVQLDSERFEDQALEALDVLWRVEQGLLLYDEDEQCWIRPLLPEYEPPLGFEQIARPDAPA